MDTTAIEPHAKATFLSNLILGGQDGLVNVLGVILGVAAASNDGRIVLAELDPEFRLNESSQQTAASFHLPLGVHSHPFQ